MQYFTINTCSRQLFDFIIDSGKKSWTTTTTRFLGFILSSVRRRFFTNLFFFRPMHRIRRMTIWNFWSNKIDANLNVLEYCARVSINFCGPTMDGFEKYKEKLNRNLLKINCHLLVIPVAKTLCSCLRSIKAWKKNSSVLCKSLQIATVTK